jgi:N-methylhydantoinase A
MELRIGIDVGGTFTDLFLQDVESGQFWLAKTPSTPTNQADGVIAGLNEICNQADIEPDDLAHVLHGTTVATNAVLEGKGARTGLLITQGWRHILHVATSWTPGPLFGFFSYSPPEPLVPFERIREVKERVKADGTVLTELDLDDAATQIQSVLDEGVEALTICFFNSFINPAHEQQVKELAATICEERGLSIPISASYEVSPEFREYPRVITTIMNSYLGPAMGRYLATLEEQLVAAAKVEAPLQVVRSDGGLMSVDTARHSPVQTALSGPSGGVNGAAFVAQRAGFDKILTFDMGGTSTDVAVCFDGEPTITRESRVGSFPVRAPSVDVETIGAGGGSIADVSEVTGSLRVGPESAGADPGPAAYGHGGSEPTVTDANVVLGHLPPVLLGGAMKLDTDAAKTAVEKTAKDLGVDVYRAAQAIVDIVNGNMLGALRVATVQKGLNPQEFALVSFGGAGGLHANALAASLGCYPVIVPPEAGVLSALGFVAADIRNEFVSPFQTLVGDIQIDDVRVSLAELAGKARTWLGDEGVDADVQEVRFVLDMRYQRQGYEITVEFGESEIAAFGLDDIVDRFHNEHHRLYGFLLEDGAVEIVNLRSRAIGKTQKTSGHAEEIGSADASPALVESQLTYVDGKPTEVPLYDRQLLKAGMEIKGKAIVGQYDATTVILPGHVAKVDAWLNLLIDVENK